MLCALRFVKVSKMTLEEAIKHVEEVAELWENRYKFYAQHDMSECEYSYRSRKCANEHRQLAKWLKELKKYREENDWIPCSERLPEEQNRRYWICTDTGYQCQCRWTNANPLWTILTTDWHWNIFDIPQYTKIVAWKPLSEPYRGE